MIHQFMRQEVAVPTAARYYRRSKALLRTSGRGTCLLACHSDSRSSCRPWLCRMPAGTRAAHARARAPALGLPAPPSGLRTRAPSSEAACLARPARTRAPLVGPRPRPRRSEIQPRAGGPARALAESSTPDPPGKSCSRATMAV